MLKENLSFVGICVLVFAALLGLAYLFERTVCHDLQRRSRSRNISYVAMFSALGGVLMLLEIPLFFAPGFYKIDLSELPVLMSAFYLGPVAGVITELLKVLLKLLLPFHLLLCLTADLFLREEKAVEHPIKCDLLLPGFGVDSSKGSFYPLPVVHAQSDQQSGGVLRLLGADA